MPRSQELAPTAPFGSGSALDPCPVGVGPLAWSRMNRGTIGHSDLVGRLLLYYDSILRKWYNFWGSSPPSFDLAGAL